MAPLRYLPGQNFDCSLCGKCCAGWRILVDDESASKIRGSALELRVIQETGHPALTGRRGQRETAHNAQGQCVFLNAQQLCSVQSDLGAESKPTGCHKFPFQYCRTPHGVFIGVSFYCSAAQRNQGRPLTAHADHIFALLDQETPLGEEPLPVYRKITMPWDAYGLLEDFLAEDTAGRLAGALAALSTLLAQAGSRRLELSAATVATALKATYSIDWEAPALRSQFATMVGHLEAPTDTDLPALTQALLSDQCIQFQRFQNWTGPLSRIEEAGKLEPWAQSELERYLKALLFRKFLVAERPIQHNLALLYLLPRLFRVCVGLSRLSRGADAVEPVDIYRAFDECEFVYMTHAVGLERTLATLGRSFVTAATQPRPASMAGVPHDAPDNQGQD